MIAMGSCQISHSCSGIFMLNLRDTPREGNFVYTQEIQDVHGTILEHLNIPRGRF